MREDDRERWQASMLGECEGAGGAVTGHTKEKTMGARESQGNGMCQRGERRMRNEQMHMLDGWENIACVM